MIARDAAKDEPCADTPPSRSSSPLSPPSPPPLPPSSSLSSSSSRTRHAYTSPPVLNPLARMASIHALPVELLTRIFALGTRDPLLDHSSPSIPRDPPFEVLVSHVCPHWRDIALRTPYLWSSIVLTRASHIPRARAYVARSARLPFDILFDSASDSDYVRGLHIFRDEFLPAFDPLKPHIDRWRSLVLRVRDLICKRHARTVLSTVGPAPQLHALELWHIEDWGDVDRLWGHVGPPPVVVFDGQLPVLRRLSLIGVNIQWSAKSSPFLRNLTDLELGVHSDDVRIPFDRWLDVLRQSPRLERLSLHYSGPRIAAPPWDLPDGPVPLPELRELKLADLDASYAYALLRTFVAPNVRKLHLELGAMADTPQDYTPFVELLVNAPDPAACPAVLDPAVIYIPSGADASPPLDAADASSPGTAHANDAPRRAMFPHLEELSVAAIATCTLASWDAFLGGAAHVHTLSVDFAQMDEGAFEVLAGALPRPFPLVTHYAHGLYHHRENLWDAIDEAAGLTGLEPEPPVRPPMDPRLLPALQMLRVSGVPGALLARYWRARRARGCPVARLLVNVKDRDPEMEALKAEVEALARAAGKAGEAEAEALWRVEWFNDEEDEEGEEGVGEEGEEADEGEGEGEDEGEREGEDEGVSEGEDQGEGEDEGEENDEDAYVPGSGSDDASSEDHHYHHRGQQDYHHPHHKGLPLPTAS